MRVSLVAIDLAKEVFQLHGVDESGRTIFRNRLRRNEVLRFFAQLPPCRVAMEACGSSHYWAREFRSQNHVPLLIAGQHVKPFKKTTQKNDSHDAQAIAEAALRPSMRFVAEKNLASQDLQSLHRVRQQFVKMRTALVNQCHGLALEYGIVLPTGVSKLTAELAEVLEQDNGLTIVARELLLKLREQVGFLTTEILSVEQKLKSLGSQSEDYARLVQVPGVGPMTASLFLASVGDASVFKNGRHLSAWMGLVPRQYSSGGSSKLMGITKAGDSELRAMMIHGARALILATKRRNGKDPMSCWILNLLEKKGWNVTAVAVANRNARVMCQLIKTKKEYRLQMN